MEMEVCLRCWSRVRRMRCTAADYAELLGLYLGDGCISEHPRTSRLRIALDAKYPDIIRDAKELLERVFPDNPVGLVEAHDGTMFFVSVYSTHLTCLFPQHGDGRKHERPIVLEDWQRRLVEDAPWSLLRGLIRSDGCVFINRTGRYEYLSYDFTNKSKDIAELFTRTCDLVGVQYRMTCWRESWRIRINRRASVELMHANVGIKS